MKKAPILSASCCLSSCGGKTGVQEILAYFEEMVEMITIIGNEITVVILPSLVHEKGHIVPTFLEQNE